MKPPLRDLHGDAVDEATVQRMWRGVAARRAIARPPVQRLTLALAAALVLAVLAIVWTRVPALRAGGPLTRADGTEIGQLEAREGEPAGAPVALSDGSSLVLSPGARLTVIESTGSRFSALQLGGRVEFRVKPGGPRHWAIACGLTTVEVAGTHFVVERSAERVRVEVQEGVVLVRGERVPEGIRRIVAGEALEIAASPVGPAASSAPSAPPAGAATSDDLPAPSVAVVRPAPSASRVGWRDLASRGENQQAYEALGREGIAQQARAASVDDLLALADVARLSGHPADALDPLQRVVDGHPADARAALAAFTLGRVALDSVGQPARAASAFARALSLGLPAGLREDASARLVEARARAGDRAGARQAADDYARSYPSGRHAAAIERWSAPGAP